MRQFLSGLTHLTKLSLNLAILTVLGLLGWFGYTLFTKTVTSQTDAIKGTAIFIGGLVGCILLIKLSRRIDTQPSMKVTIFGLLAISIIAGLAGVEPLAGYLAYLGNLQIGILPQLVALGFLLNPLYVIAAIALIVWIIVTIRRG